MIHLIIRTIEHSHTKAFVMWSHFLFKKTVDVIQPHDLPTE